MAKIIGLGSWFPDTVRKNSDWSSELVQSFEKHSQRELVDAAKMESGQSQLDPYTIAGFKSEAGDPFLGATERRIVGDSFKAWEAESAAALVAIDQSGIDPQEIGVVLSYSFAPDMINGNSAAMVITKLGLNNAYGIGADGACSSAIAQLGLAKALINSEDAKYVLLTQSNFMSKGIPLGHPAAPGIGDAATAILVGADYDCIDGHHITNVHTKTIKDYYEAVMWRRKEENQEWYNPGGPFYIGSFCSPKAKFLVEQTVPFGAQTIKEALEFVELEYYDLNFIASVQPRKWIPAAIAQTLGLSVSQTIETFDQYAHLGCCGPIVNLIEAVEQNKIKRGDVVALYAQGAGFTRSAAIIDW